jgi:predicted Kef-type K+ transport protein
MVYLWVAVAFLCGFLVKQANLPPLIGYLAAGFGLHALGVEPDASLQTLADLGVTLLLFTIGLKLNIHSLFKTEIWGSATAHMSVIVLLTMLNCFLLAYVGFNYFVGLDWAATALIGFAVSFSSTVCAVKILEDRGEMRARHGQVTIGILIIQDIAAVIFVSLATDTSPSWWALALLALPLVRPILNKLLERCGHGEMLPLAGFFLALTGGELFELVGLKAHLGALVIAVLLSGHSKATELSKSLLSFKDIFLIGFFLSIGFTALPTVDMLGAALIMAIALPVKTGLFFLWQTRLKLRGRTAFLSALSLSNYSEFGLIVCSASVAHGLLAKEWLVIMALAMSLSFVLSSIINTKAHYLYIRWNGFIKRFEQPERLPEDQFAQPEGAVLVIGMGRVGAGAYDSLRDDLNKDVCGVDVDRERVTAHCHKGRNVTQGDAEDPDFWAHINLDNVQLIILTMPNYQDNIETVKQLKHVAFQGKTAGIAHYEDEKKILLDAGIDVVFNLYDNAGAGLAEHSIHLFDSDLG